MKTPNLDQILGYARHALTAAGGALVTDGALSQATFTQWQTYLGMVLAIAGLFASHQANATPSNPPSA